eukprot:scaffold22747_cov129-Isochrysis_galbana.AAC.3
MRGRGRASARSAAALAGGQGACAPLVLRIAVVVFSPKFSASPAAGARETTRHASARADSGLLVLLITRAVARNAQVISHVEADGMRGSWLGTRGRLFSATLFFSPLIHGSGAKAPDTTWLSTVITQTNAQKGASVGTPFSAWAVALLAERAPAEVVQCCGIAWRAVLASRSDSLSGPRGLPKVERPVSVVDAAEVAQWSLSCRAARPNGLDRRPLLTVSHLQR